MFTLYTACQVFSIPGTSQSLQLVMIDTVILAGLTHPTMRDLPPSGPASLAMAETQWQWIEQTLSSSTADWIIVAGHYPGIYNNIYIYTALSINSLSAHTVWSIAEHGPTQILVDQLRPLLQKYNVSS